MINALIAIRALTYRSLRAAARVDAPSRSVQRAWRFFRNQGADAYRRLTIDSQAWRVIDLVLDGPAELNRLVDAHAVKVLGAWNADGSQVGTVIARDSAGVLTGVTGAPDYPIDRALLLDAMPDIVTRDAVGAEISRVRPTELAPVAELMGWAPRR